MASKAELRQRIRDLERELDYQKAATAEWHRLWERQVTKIPGPTKTLRLVTGTYPASTGSWTSQSNVIPFPLPWTRRPDDDDDPPPVPAMAA